MRKTIIIGLVALLSVVLTYGFADAKVTGVCSGCHTMHNMQDGVVVVAGGPYSQLLKNTCLGCHSSATSNTIVSNTPIVYNTAGGITDPGTSQTLTGDTMSLAGGNFYYVATHSKVHNVDGLTIDSPLGNNPPGYDGLLDEASTNYDPLNRLTCAGQNGCHGNRDITNPYASIRTAHHTNVLGGAHNTADTVANSFRFLKGVKGFEDTNWQQTANAVAATVDHNEYKGATTKSTLAATGTISALCRQCHGVFHDTVGVDNAWTRHPTDIDVIVQGGEYANYNIDVTPAKTYSLHAPVGYVTDLVAARATVTTGESIVMCLSCHRAHGSNYADILRWDYTTLNVAGTGTDDLGCFVCHTTKNAD